MRKDLGPATGGGDPRVGGIRGGGGICGGRGRGSAGGAGSAGGGDPQRLPSRFQNDLIQIASQVGLKRGEWRQRNWAEEVEGNRKEVWGAPGRGVLEQVSPAGEQGRPRTTRSWEGSRW